MIRYLDALRGAFQLDTGPLLKEPDDHTRVLTEIEWARARHTYGAGPSARR